MKGPREQLEEMAAMGEARKKIDSAGRGFCTEDPAEYAMVFTVEEVLAIREELDSITAENKELQEKADRFSRVNDDTIMRLLVESRDRAKLALDSYESRIEVIKRYQKASPKEVVSTDVSWPDKLRIRNTGIHDDTGGLGQPIFTTAGQGYEKVPYVREDLFSLLVEALKHIRDQDHVENALDPQWASRIAKVALLSTPLTQKL